MHTHARDFQSWPIHTFSWGREAEMVVKETMSEKNMVTFFFGLWRDLNGSHNK